MIEGNFKEGVDIIYLQTTTIADFIIDADKNKQQPIPGMNDLVLGLRRMIDQVYKKKDKRRMRLLFKNFKEMMKGLTEEEISELSSIFENKNVRFP